MKLWILKIFENSDKLVDSAICYAETKKEAMNKFAKLYSGFKEKDVYEAAFNKYDVCCITEY